jgi:hypothetical protein
MDQHLRENNRSYLSACLITGVWTEGFYLMTQVAKENFNEQLKEQIGGQKEILTRLIHVLKVFEEHPDFAKLVVLFKKLQTDFAGVTITIQKIEPKKVVTESGITFYPEEMTVIEFDQETLNKIINTTEKIRNNLIDLK